MQNKGAIKFIAIALALVVIYQLSFTFMASRVRTKAEKIAQVEKEGLIVKDPIKEKKFLDSIAGEPVYNFLGIRKFTYRECQERELNLGLDLKGGMNVILEISVSDVIKALADGSKDSTFIAALHKAKEYQKNSQDDFVTLFGRAFSEIAPNGRLATIFSTKDMREKVGFNSTNLPFIYSYIFLKFTDFVCFIIIVNCTM